MRPGSAPSSRRPISPPRLRTASTRPDWARRRRGTLVGQLSREFWNPTGSALPLQWCGHGFRNATPPPSRRPGVPPASHLGGAAPVLSTSKVLAGGMAATTTAVLGSYFGVLGTVGGAALGSVATALSTEAYERSIHRATARLRTRTSGGSRGDRPGQRVSDATHRPRLPRFLIGIVVIFALGMGVVTGIEWATGGPLSGGTQGTTSLGDVLHVDQVPVLGDLLGSTPADDSSHAPTTRRRNPGLVGGLLSSF